MLLKHQNSSHRCVKGSLNFERCAHASAHAHMHSHTHTHTHTQNWFVRGKIVPLAASDNSTFR
jgi:hypothetical protein